MILIGLGANLPSRFGPPPATLEAAIAALADYGLTVTAKSRIWLTAPVPISNQPWYHNAVIAIETSLPPLELLKTLQTIENEFGRVRLVRNEPRVIDLDLLAYNDVILNDPTLTIPHPRMHQRNFVLLPIKDIAPDWTHPVLKTSLNDMIAELPKDQDAKPYEDAA